MESYACRRRTCLANDYDYGSAEKKKKRSARQHCERDDGPSPAEFDVAAVMVAGVSDAMIVHKTSVGPFLL